MLFFGHLRDRTAEDIEQGLAKLDLAKERQQLAEQLRVMSRIAWRKHAWLQTSIAMLVLGSAGLFINLTVFDESGSPSPKNPPPHLRKTR